MPVLLFLLSLILLAGPAQAENYSFINECKKRAVADLAGTAQSVHKASLDRDTVYISDIDDRWYNPSKYIWFTGVAKKPNGETVKVQNMYQVSRKDLKECKLPSSFKSPSDKKFVKECSAAGEVSLKRQAKRSGMKYVEGSLVVTEVDDRKYNPSKYVWVKAKAKKKDGSTVFITDMLQKSYLPPGPCGDYKTESFIEDGSQSTSNASGQ